LVHEVDVLVGANMGKSPVISHGGRGEGRARGERSLMPKRKW